MKLAFSTLACPRWSFNDIFSTAKDLGYDGIEIRGIADQLYAPSIEVFSNDKIEATKQKLKAGNLEISMLTSGSTIAVYSEKEQAIAEAKAYIDLAEKLGVKFVRILCTNSPKPDGGDIELAAQSYKLLCDYGKTKGVMPLVETNGMFCDSSLLKKFIEDIDSDNKGVLWDVHHPYRFGGESIAVTARNIGKFVKYVHVKDSAAENGTTVYKMMGKGDIPIAETLLTLKKLNYDGYVSLEWVKRWNKNLEEPGIVVAHFINYIKAMI